MNAAKTTHGIYNIPSGIAFSKALAAQLMDETKGQPEALAAYRILLPTRRAARVLREAFLHLSDGQPLLLPHMHAIGDIDEEELSLSGLTDLDSPFLEIPPAMPAIKRQILLAKAIAKIPGYGNNFEQALLLSRALGQFMDQAYTEGISLDRLADLVPTEFAQHWQITLTFMEVLTQAWPEILAVEGQIEAAQRRNLLLQQLAQHWHQSPPSAPVIAAGSTGSIPAAAELLKVIAQLPQGRVVLPGLDQTMDETSWENLDETHPQYILRKLLNLLGLTRNDIQPWPSQQKDTALPRRLLAGEIMRPSATSTAWAQDLPLNKTTQQNIAESLKNLQILTCGNEREEAAAIAILLRETLETPGRTAAIITPKRSLARRIMADCRRWDIVLDDSAGQTLDQTPIGLFLQLIVRAAAADFSPVALLALLKHPFCQIKNLEQLDHDLRGLKPPPGLEGILERDSGEILRVIAPFFCRFMAGSLPEKPRQYSEILTAHLHLAEQLADPETLWRGPEGEAAAQFFASLQDYASYVPEMDLSTYADTLGTLLKTVTVRPPFGTHPRLQLLGQLEARMIDADLVILAGLNEGSWPPDPGHDPWMSRPMRAQFGLPGRDRSIGLASHDFVQGLCAPNVVLSRSARQGGAATVPARWLQRLSAVLQAVGLLESQIDASHLIARARALDEATSINPVLRPGPVPPLSARPRRLSVTQIEHWQKDPYGIYAQHVLKLRKMDALEKPVEESEKGILLHNILRNFSQTISSAFPQDAASILVRIAAEELDKRHDDPAVWSFWHRRFARTADWLINHETDWRRAAKTLGTEIAGSVQLAAQAAPFTLTARADRIDQTPIGAVIIDYKSGGSYSLKAMEQGDLPQLPLEGLILTAGGFENLPALPVTSLQYWKLSGGLAPGEIKALDKNVGATIERAETGLTALIDAFDDPETPYYALPRLDRTPRFSDYKHLERVQEWAALGEDDAATEAA